MYNDYIVFINSPISDSAVYISELLYTFHVFHEVTHNIINLISSYLINQDHVVKFLADSVTVLCYQYYTMNINMV